MIRQVIFATITFCTFAAQWLLAGDIEGTVLCKGVRSNQGAVVYLEKIEGEFKPPENPAVMDQRNLKFYPHILTITVGTTVDFLNSDDVLHNVFSPEVCANKFNLGTWPKGDRRSRTFTVEGCYSIILCNVHPEMEAWILVLQNPYYAVTDENGFYRIKDIPPGTFNLVVWHERLKKKILSVEVTPTGETTVNIILTRR